MMQKRIYLFDFNPDLQPKPTPPAHLYRPLKYSIAIATLAAEKWTQE
jgi:hypothetical protein